MFIKPTNNADSLWRVNEEVAVEILLIPKQDEFACPWDADISVNGNIVTLQGSIAGGPGTDELGSCICKVAVDKFTDYYQLELPDSIIEEKGIDINALVDAGWVEVR